MKTNSYKYFRWSFWVTVELVHQKTKSWNLVARKFMWKRKITRVRCPENFYRQCVGSRKVFPGTYKQQTYFNNTRTFMYLDEAQNEKRTLDFVYLYLPTIYICIHTIFLFYILYTYQWWIQGGCEGITPSENYRISYFKCRINVS